MPVAVKMPNGDYETFSSASMFHVNEDKVLILGTLGAEQPEAVFADGGWWAVWIVPERGPCAVCGERPENMTPRCRTGGRYGKHAYVETDAA